MNFSPAKFSEFRSFDNNPRARGVIMSSKCVCSYPLVAMFLLCQCVYPCVTISCDQLIITADLFGVNLNYWVATFTFKESFPRNGCSQYCFILDNLAGEIYS
jgi:hypothetical protein